MDRNLNIRHIPKARSHYEPVDQYMFREQDTTKHTEYNGLSYPVYSADGNISYTLPLEQYPIQGSIHPQVLYSEKGVHMPNRFAPSSRFEGFYGPNLDSYSIPRRYH